MALLNNVYYNAAFMGCIHGALAGRDIKSATAADYLALTQAAKKGRRIKTKEKME